MRQAIAALAIVALMGCSQPEVTAATATEEDVEARIEELKLRFTELQTGTLSCPARFDHLNSRIDFWKEYWRDEPVRIPKKWERLDEFEELFDEVEEELKEHPCRR